MFADICIYLHFLSSATQELLTRVHIFFPICIFAYIFV